MTKVFTYGTLKKGFGNHYLLKDSSFLGEVKTLPEFTMISLGGFPGILTGGHTSISGEVYEVNTETLAKLDRLEGHPTWYRRTPITLLNDEKVETYIYLKSNPSPSQRFPIVESGEWKKSSF